MKKTKKKATHRPANPAPRRRPQPTAAIVVRPPSPKPWLISAPELVILKNSICKGATDQELEWCLVVARRYQLDPFQGQIWFVPFYDREALRSDGSGKTGAKVWTPVVGITGLLHIAARDHKDFGTYSKPELGPMMQIEFRICDKGNTLKMNVPEWASIKAYKKGSTIPTETQVWWEEIYPNVNYAPLVRRMPRLMLGKCAKAQATRTAYPKTGGLYIAEEVEGRERPLMTPGGRVMTLQQPQPGGDAAHDRYLAREAEILAAMPPEQREQIEEMTRRSEEARSGMPATAQGAHTVIDVKPKPDVVTYRAEADGGPYFLDGPEKLLHEARELVRPYYSQKRGCLVIERSDDAPTHLGKLLAALERLKIPFRAVD